MQAGPAMWEGRMKSRTEDMLSAEEWAEAKEKLRAIPSGGGKILFSEEFFCACREQPGEAAARWPAPAGKCPAGKAFGVLGVTGRFRRCLHALS